MTPDEADRKPLLDMKGNRVPLWDDPRLSPEDRHAEWIRGHVEPPVECPECGGDVATGAHLLHCTLD